MKATYRLAEMDSLRGLAAIGICLFHFALLPSNVLFLKYFRFGVTGVDLFFMISGFVIFMSLNAIQTLKDFWAFRCFRLYPAYWLSIIIAIINYNFLVHFNFHRHWNDLIGNLLMIQPLFKSENLVDAYWTLYVELCFYTFISLVWYFKLTAKIEQIILAGLTFILIINSFYLLLETSSAGYVHFFILFRGVMPLISFFGFFASGIAYYNIYIKGWSLRRITILIFSFLLTLVIHSISGKANLFVSLWERIMCEAVFNLLLILIVSKKAGFLKARWMMFLGTISYALYLIHESIGIGINKYLLLFTNSQFAALVGVAGSIVLAGLITYLYDKPIHAWLKKQYLTNTPLIKVPVKP